MMSTELRCKGGHAFAEGGWVRMVTLTAKSAAFTPYLRFISNNSSAMGGNPSMASSRDFFRATGGFTELDKKPSSSDMYHKRPIYLFARHVRVLQ